MLLDIKNIIVVITVSIIIIVCFIGIVISSIFQNKQKKKYKEVKNIIKEKNNAIFKIKDGFTKEDIKSIDDSVDVDKLMKELYNTYLELEKKVKTLNNDFDDILVGNLKEYYINKIKNFKEMGICEVTDDINLIGYSIIEYNKGKIKFRVNITCYSYKVNNNEIISGSNLKKVEQIILLDYKKEANKWYIYNYEKIYDKKLGN